ncbi:hypothetical protein FQA39_LY02876 [Lamprigera yunnana]|nr:hypothetical protein FQA39_LY02876 [Lamprigera yunnana]
MILVTIFILGLLLLLSIYKYGTHKFDYWEKRNIPFIKPTFFFGILYSTVVKQKPISIYLAEFYNKFNGPFFGYYALRSPFLVLTDVKAIKRFLIKDAEYFSDRYVYNDPAIDPVIAYGLFGAKGALWKDLKNCFTPFFTVAKVKSMFSLLKDSRKHFDDYLETNANENIDAKKMSQKFAASALARCVMGININTFTDAHSMFGVPHKHFTSSSIWRTFSLLCYYYSPTLVGLFGLKFFPQSMKNLIVEMFDASVKERESLKIKNGDMIDLFVELKNKKLADLGLCNLGCSDSSSLYILLCWIGVNIQSRLRNEILHAKQKHGEIRYDVLQEMEYLNMIVSETLRKYPATPQIHRQCVKDYKVPNTDVIIEKGTKVTISSFGLHRNEKFFCDPEKFDPERFNIINRNKIQDGSYLPFGEGLRSCLAKVFGTMIVKIGIVQLIENYEVIKNLKTPSKIEFTMFPALIQTNQSLNMTLRKLG